MIALETIAFNHDDTSAVGDALNIRRNLANSVTIPEWRAGMTSADDCPIAYAIEPTRGRALTIEATFRRLHSSVGAVSVRTSPQTMQELMVVTFANWFLTQFSRWFGRRVTLFVFGRAPAVPQPEVPPPTVLPLQNVLGEVGETLVSFGAIDVVTLKLRLRDTRIWTQGVGDYIDTWRWQFQAAGRVLVQQARDQRLVRQTFRERALLDGLQILARQANVQPAILAERRLRGSRVAGAFPLGATNRLPVPALHRFENVLLARIKDARTGRARNGPPRRRSARVGPSISSRTSACKPYDSSKP